MASTTWRPVTALLGLAPPPPRASKRVETPAPVRSEALKTRDQVRADSAYRTARTMVKILAGFALLALVVIGLAATFGTQMDVATRATALVALSLQSFVVIVSAVVVNAIFDIADCNLRRER